MCGRQGPLRRVFWISIQWASGAPKSRNRQSRNEHAGHRVDGRGVVPPRARLPTAQLRNPERSDPSSRGARLGRAWPGNLESEPKDLPLGGTLLAWSGRAAIVLVSACARLSRSSASHSRREAKRRGQREARQKSISLKRSKPIQAWLLPLYIGIPSKSYGNGVSQAKHSSPPLFNPTAPALRRDAERRAAIVSTGRSRSTHLERTKDRVVYFGGLLSEAETSAFSAARVQVCARSISACF